jgi:RNA polymerase sigma-54 factor
MKQSLQLKLGQQLTMTPQLQQAIRLLQLSTLDLQSEIQEALEANPMLEVAEDEASNDYHGEETAQETPQFQDSGDTNDRSNGDEIGTHREETEDHAPDGEWSHEIPTELAVDTSWDDVYQSAPTGTGLSKPENDDMDFESRRGNSESLQDYLAWQLNLTPMSDVDRHVAESVIDAVGPTGVLVQSVEEIWQGLLKDLPELELDEVFAVLHRLQQFDPAGVASQDLSECLLLQLRQLPTSLPSYDVAVKLVQNYLPLLGARDFKQLMRRLKVKENELQEAIKIVQSLNPRPGERIGQENTEYIVPDVFVKKENNRWCVNLNPEVAPKLRINADYASLVRRADSSSDNSFLRDNLQEARWFIKSLQSRNETLLKVATCIVERQQGFLDNGPEAMKPMVLHDVAEMVEMHESTISRVTTQKFMHTPQGIFELKYFFSSHVSTESGGECSSTAIRAIIKKLVAAENPRKPLSDSKITALLEEQGIHVARRTIAKYRESLSIAPSNERKRLV